MTEVRIDEALWANAMAPEGILARWTAKDGAEVDLGAHVADVLIEGARHKIMAPAAGRLRHEVEKAYVIEPGSVIGRITGP
jgi:hypothetical protein